ncbi:thiolase family protein [Dactylosporangium sp. CA-139066]|uniref:thiolase family protein n=1 Tax=Dactylosporangium sp. CA-139066 TaxID=3239930 RepID=UPI003D950352
MDDVVIVDAVRTPMGRGKPGGALSGVHAVDLLAQTITGLLRRVDLDPAVVDDVIVGCVSQAGEQAGNVGRMAWLAAGLPEHVPAVTVERKCGSSQQSLHFAAQGVLAGAYDVVVVAGVESMSRIPMGAARLGMDTAGPSVTRRYEPGLVSQGVSAELVAARWKLGRDELDEYSVRSHRLAAEAADSGAFAGEIIPVRVPAPDGEAEVAADETIRRGTTVERLATLAPAFADDAVARRFPEITWSVTAGNSSQITDGASALLVMSASRAKALGLRPRARFHAFSVVGDDPVLMLTAPIPATRKVLERAGLTIGDIDHYEVNEAFASVPLAWQAEVGADPARLNPRGGAIALGHPLGASGARLMTTMLNALEATGGRYGLQTMCEAGGMANATVIERL